MSRTLPPAEPVQKTCTYFMQLHAQDPHKQAAAAAAGAAEAYFGMSPLCSRMYSNSFVATSTATHLACIVGESGEI
jgi:hypothetical protein